MCLLDRGATSEQNIIMLSSKKIIMFSSLVLKRVLW